MNRAPTLTDGHGGKRLTGRAVSIVLFAFCSTSPAGAQDLLAITWTGEVFRVDPSNGQATTVGDSGWLQTNSLASNDRGEFFTVSKSSLVQIDPVTGLGTFVADTGLQSVRGLAFGPNDVLFAIEDGGGSNPDDLYTIDSSTGTSTLVGSTGFPGVQALAHEGGRLYGWDCGSGTGTGDGLILIHPGTGAGMDVNPAIGGTCGTLQALAFDPDGRLYGARTSLYRIRTVTAGDTPPGSLRWLGMTAQDIRGIDFLQPPGPVLALVGRTEEGVGLLSVSDATPGGQVVFGLALEGGDVWMLGSAVADAAGHAVLREPLPRGTEGWMRAIDLVSAVGTGAVPFPAR